MSLLIASSLVESGLINYALLQNLAANVGVSEDNIAAQYALIVQLNTQIAQNAVVAENAKTVALNASTLLTSPWEDRGDWNPVTNLPALTATPSNHKTGEKWPMYSVPVGGVLPFAIKGYAQGAELPAGFIVGHPLENIWYWMPQVAGYDQFKKDHAMFNLGPADNIKITQGATTVTIEVTGAGLTVLDYQTGYRGLQPGSITVGNNEMVFLSASQYPAPYQDPKLYEKGVGQALYLYKGPMNARTTPWPGYAPIGIVTGFKWCPLLPVFTDRTNLVVMAASIASNAAAISSLQTENSKRIQFEQNRAVAVIGGPNKVVVTKGATQTTVQVLAGCIIIDGATGYRTLQAGTIVLNNFDILVLSKNPYPSAYADPEIHTKAVGGTVHLYKIPFNALPAEADGLFVIGAVIDFVWTSNHEAFQVHETVMDDKLFFPNMADPTKFTHGKAMGTNGVIVDSSGLFLTDYIEVTPGKTYYFRTPSNGARNVVAFNDAKQPVGGINTTWTFSYTPLAGTKYLRVNPSEADWQYFMFSEGDVGFVPYGQPAFKEVSVLTSEIVDTTNKRLVTDAQKARVDALAYRDALSDLILEEKGILLRTSNRPSPINNDLTYMRDYFLNAQTDEDFMPECFNGSKSTGIPVQAQYCPASVNSHLLFEGCRQENHYTMRCRLIWQKHFRSQLNARFDTPGFFTEVGSKLATNDARYWGHQWPDGLGNQFGGNPPNNQIYSDRYYNILSYNGANPSISFYLPSGYYKAALMMSFSHLSTATLRATVTGGNNILEYETDTPGVWAELNNHVFNCSTPDAFTPAVYRTSTQIRQDQPSMPIKFRRKDGQSMSPSIPLQFVAEDGKQIEYWGLYYTRARRLFIPILSAMGSHNNEDLMKFWPHGLDKRKSNYIFYDVDIVNNFWVAAGIPADTPSNYGDRFVNFVTALLNKSHVKGVLCSFGMWYQNMEVYEATTDMPKNYLTAEGPNDGLAYIRKGIKKVSDLKTTFPGKVAVSDATQAFQDMIEAIAAELGISKRAAMWINNSANPWDAYSPTMDGTHDGLRGAKQQFRHGMNNFNFY